MMNNTVRIAFMTLLLAGCAGEDPDVALVETFWQAMDSGDVDTLENVLSNPAHARALASVRLMADGFEVLGPSENGVDVKLVRHCYPEVVVPTILTATNGQTRVDLAATLRAQGKLTAGLEPIRKYCFGFEDQPLQGVINGEPWQAHHVDQHTIDFGSRKEEQRLVVSEPCPQDNCFSLKSPSIQISNLDLSGDGGNFNKENNITIFTPPADNILVTRGSYRVSTTPGGETRLEMSFDEGPDNTLDGYILF